MLNVRGHHLELWKTLRLLLQTFHIESKASIAGCFKCSQAEIIEVSYGMYVMAVQRHCYAIKRMAFSFARIRFQKQSPWARGPSHFLNHFVCLKLIQQWGHLIFSAHFDLALSSSRSCLLQLRHSAVQPCHLSTLCTHSNSASK